MINRESQNWTTLENIMMHSKERRGCPIDYALITLVVLCDFGFNSETDRKGAPLGTRVGSCLWVNLVALIPGR